MAEDQGFRDACARVRAGEITFDAFARMTMARWKSQARFLLRRWDAPAWVGLDDVLGVLLMSAWRQIPKWDPDRPDAKPFHEFLIWNATDKAKKMIHRARLGRRMHRGEDHQRSRYERPASSFVRQGEEGEESSLPEQAEHGRQDDLVELRRAFRRARRTARSVRELLAVQALEVTNGEVEAAADMLYRDRDARFEGGFGSEREAFKAAQSAACRVIGKLEIAADSVAA